METMLVNIAQRTIRRRGLAGRSYAEISRFVRENILSPSQEHLLTKSHRRCLQLDAKANSRRFYHAFKESRKTIEDDPF